MALLKQTSSKGHTNICLSGSDIGPGYQPMCMWWTNICLTGSDIGPSYQLMSMWWANICLSGSDIDPSYQPLCDIDPSYQPLCNVQKLDPLSTVMSVFHTTLRERKTYIHREVYYLYVFACVDIPGE